MKFYVMKDGKLVEASVEEMKNLSLDLYSEDGTKVREAKAAAPPEPNPMDLLAKAVTDLGTKVGTIGDLSAKMDAFEARQKATDAAIAKSFVVPGIVEASDVKVVGDDNDVMKFIGGHFDLKRQGKNLQVKYPNWKPSEKTIRELTKYWGLVALCSGKHPQPKALDFFYNTYGQIKTPLGDAGNVFPVPDIVDDEILVFARERSVVLQYARMWDMTSEKMSFPTETSGVTVAWGNTTGESEPGIDEVELTASELSAYSAVRNSTLADSLSDIVSWLTEAMGEAAGLELDNKAFNGLGVDNPFICSGILSAACGFSVTLGTGSTAFSQVTAQKLSEMIGKLDGMRKDGARFWLHGQTLHHVRSLQDANGRPIFIETVGAPMSGTIWGYPYTEVIKCPSNTASNTAYMAFGNLKYFAVGRRLNTAALDVDPYGLFTTNRTRFKLYQRWALSMGIPGGFVRLLTAS